MASTLRRNKMSTNMWPAEKMSTELIDLALYSGTLQRRLRRAAVAQSALTAMKSAATYQALRNSDNSEPLHLENFDTGQRAVYNTIITKMIDICNYQVKGDKCDGTGCQFEKGKECRAFEVNELVKEDIRKEIMTENLATNVQQCVERYVKDVEPNDKLILWTGYTESMLEVALRLAKKSNICTIEGSNLSNAFLTRFGSWDDEYENIKEKYKVQLEPFSHESRDRLIKACRKGMWDHISRLWARSQKKVCIVIVPDLDVDQYNFSKTLFQIELPIIRENPSITTVLVVKCSMENGRVYHNVIYDKGDLEKTVRLFCETPMPHASSLDEEE